MKKIPHGSSHHGSGFTPSSPGYNFGDVHDSHPPPYAPSYPEFKPIGPSSSHSHYRSHKPTYSNLIKGVFSASSSPVVKPGHSSPPLSHVYHGPSPPHSYHGPPSHHSQMEYDYDPSLSIHSHQTGAKFPTSSGPGTSFVPSSHQDTHHTVSSQYGPPTGSAPINSPPSTNYGYPVANVEPQKHQPNVGHSDLHHNTAPNAHQLIDAYNNQPSANLPQIHITPTTNFIEYTNIQNTDTQQTHYPQQQALVQHQSQAQQASATSQQMAEEVIKYLGKLQQGGHGNGNGNANGNVHGNGNGNVGLGGLGGIAGGDQNGNPQLFFGLNVPLGAADVGGGGGEVQDDSFPLYPPGTGPHDSQGHASQVFMPTPLPPDSSANSYAPSGTGEYSGEQIPPLYPQNANGQYPVDSYGHPVQVSKTLHKNHNHINNHQQHHHQQQQQGQQHVQFLKAQPSSHHHPKGVSAIQPRHKTKPEFDIVRSVSFELGAPGPIMHH